MAKGSLEALRRTNPQKYKAIMQRQRRHAFVPHSPGQRAVLESKARFVVVRAGRRWGKTKVAARRLIRHAMRNPGTVDWWVANTYKNTRRGYREVVRQLPPQFLKKPAPPATANDLILELKNGARIEFYSSTNPDAMAGEGVGYVVVDEAALQAEAVWYQIIRPTLMDHGGGALLISTPRGRNWFWEMDQRGRSERFPQYESFHFTTADNPLITPDELEEAQAALPDMLYRQEILAEFIAGAAGVFLIPKESVIAEPVGVTEGDRLVMGVDLAKHHDFTVLDAVRTSDRMPVYHDRFNAVRWGEQREHIIATVHALEAQGATVTVAIDATGVGDVVFDDLEDAGLDVVPIKFGQGVTGATERWKSAAVKLLAADLERGDAYILEEQRREFEDYEYRITSSGNFKYGAPEGAGHHDDEVSAKLLQHWVLVHDTLEYGVRTMDTGPARAPNVEAELRSAEERARKPIKPRSAAELLNDPAVWH